DLRSGWKRSNFQSAILSRSRSGGYREENRNKYRQSKFFHDQCTSSFRVIRQLRHIRPPSAPTKWTLPISTCRKYPAYRCLGTATGHDAGTGERTLSVFLTFFYVFSVF